MNKQRKTSHILNVFQYDADGHVVLPASLTLSIAPGAGDNNSKVPTTSWVRTYVTGLSYLTGNQSITFSGDATGSGTTSIALTLANTAVTPGTYGSTTLVPVVTVDSKGRITSVTTAAISGSLTFTGDVTGSGTTGTSTAMTLAASGVTAGTYTKVTVDSKGRVTVGASATTTDIAEGTNLYYTDARVLSYLSANTYATQSYVNTQVSNLVAAAPATLDTLNELAAALGNDPSFATTISTALGNRLRVDINNQGLSATLQGYGRTNLGLGTAATANTGDFVAYRTFGTAANSAIGDFVAYRTFGTAANNNTGDFAAASHTHSIANVTGLQTALDGKQASGSYAASSHSHIISDVTGLQTALDGKQASLGFTPYNSTNPSGYISGITSGNVTTALGYTPYNATNPAGYITGVTNISGTAGSISGFNNPTTAATANTIVYRDGSGDIYGRYLFGSYQNSSDDVSAGTITYIMAKFGDNYHRSATAAKVQAFLGLGSAAYQNTGAFLSTSGSVTINGDLTVGVGGSSNIYMNDSDEGQRQIHCNSNRIGFLTQAGAWGAYCDDAGNWFANNLSGTNTGDQTNISGNAATATTSTYSTYLNPLSGDGNYKLAYTANGARTNAGEWGRAVMYYVPNGQTYGIRVDRADYSDSTGSVAWTNVSSRPTALSSFTNDLGNYGGWITSAGQANSTSPNYAGGVQANPQVYFNNGIGLKVAMTGSWSTWSDTVWVNGYTGSDVPWMCALHFLRNSQPRFAISAQTRESTTYGAYYEVITAYNIASQSVSYASTSGTAGNITAHTINQSVGSSNAPTFAGITINGQTTINRHIDANTGWGAAAGNTIFVGWSGGKVVLGNNANGGHDYANGITVASVVSTNPFFCYQDITAYSDARVKDNVEVIDNAVEKIKAIRGVTYTRSDNFDKEKRHAGVIAQEVLKVLPEVVSGSEDSVYSVAYGNMAALFIEAIKEQQLQIEELKNKLDSLIQN
jgi:hypothetical protein